jgi:hypothetical protein
MTSTLTWNYKLLESTLILYVPLALTIASSAFRATIICGFHMLLKTTRLYFPKLTKRFVWVTEHSVRWELQIQLELMMMSDVPLATYSAFSERRNNKFYYKVASCWLFLLNCLLRYTPRGHCRSQGTVSIYLLWATFCTFCLLAFPKAPT